jgi:integrase/recombinase XerD
MPDTQHQTDHSAHAAAHQRDAAQSRDVDIYTIALWLGHATVKSTEIYLHADTKLKHEAIQRAAPIGTRPGRYRPPDTLLAFLEGL